MAVWGGSNHQKRAARSKAAQEKTSIKDGQPCPKGKCHLRVAVIRADTNEGITDLSVKIDGPTKGTSKTVKKTGLADFGEVKEGQYTISVTLEGDDKKRYEELKAPVSLTIAKGEMKAQMIKLAPLVKFRVVLVDGEDKALKDIDWDLNAPAKKGKTDAKGLIEADLPWDSDAARALKIKLPAPQAPQQPQAQPQPPGQPPPVPPYPAPIDAAQFTDDAPKKLEAVTDVEWKITLADLPDGDNADGVVARLANLGYDPSDDAKTKRAVQTYQLVYLKKSGGSGKPKDILDDIKTRHDTSP